MNYSDDFDQQTAVVPASFRNHILQHTGEDTPHTVSAKIKMTNITRLEEEKHYISNAGSFFF